MKLNDFDRKLSIITIIILLLTFQRIPTGYDVFMIAGYLIGQFVIGFFIIYGILAIVVGSFYKIKNGKKTNKHSSTSR